MARTSDDELEFNFDQIYEDFKSGVAELQVLKSSCNAEIKKREALQITCNTLKLDNERLTKLYTESFNKMADQLEWRTKCQSLEKELKRLNDERLGKEDEYRTAMEVLKQNHATKVGDLETQIRGILLQTEANEATIKQNHATKIGDLETQIRGVLLQTEANEATIKQNHATKIGDLETQIRGILLQKEANEATIKQNHATKIGDLETQIRGILLQKEANEATIKQLHQDLAMHRTHIQALTKRLERVCFDVETKYHHEIQDLKDCLLVEQEEKNELNKKLQLLEKESMFSRTKLVEQQRDLNSNRNVEMLKEKVMKLRKENEVLKRQIHHGLKES